jgi:hypothetical protein
MLQYDCTGNRKQWLWTLESLVITISAIRFNMNQISPSVHTVYLCVLCGSENKQRLFPYTTLTDWFL